MLTHYAAYRVQAESKSLPDRLGGKERLKDACRKCSVDSHSVIPDLHERHFSSRSGGHFQSAPSVGGVDGVLYKRRPHLTQLSSVSSNKRHRGVVVAHHHHSLQLWMEHR